MAKLHQLSRVRRRSTGITCQKKADVAEHPEVFRHVGLLFIAPSGICRIARDLVVRKFATRQNKKADAAKPLRDSTASAYSLSRPPASAELRFVKSSEID